MQASADLLAHWQRVVNCSAAEIEEWHTTAESAAVGTRRPGDRWSVGQLAGMRTSELLEMPLEEWTASEWAHVRRVTGFVRRHRAQWPRGDVAGSRWRHALRNWGHDPLWGTRLTLSPGDERGRREVLVDSHPVGRLDLDVTSGAVATVERLELDEVWQRRGIGTAVLHLVAVEHHGRVEVLTTGAAPGVVERLARRHWRAPAPGAPALVLEGW
ncbi:DUF3140 domain-containing protein [Nocardioides sp. Y6]|uniref:DUF3140 domain-containing protein n=1 Tax=Nocardioides malaquae TaxID=2773426 RepID=A0ABR9RS43_9ACTN|nr:DUF3140 domain-containing protein [Nocardioides malaquae]MBE7324394.1 DUF3140 domain-containing protein [Nocardioides malaquae]